MGLSVCATLLVFTNNINNSFKLRVLLCIIAAIERATLVTNDYQQVKIFFWRFE